MIDAVPGVVRKAYALVVLVARDCAERVDIRHEIAAAAARYLHAGLHVGDAHIRQCVVARLDEDARRAGLAVADDVDVGYVAIGRIVVRAVLDVQTDVDAFH